MQLDLMVSARARVLKPIKLVLPYPISANRYWRHRAVKNVVYTYVSTEAKLYRDEVARIALAAGVRKPLPGRVGVRYTLYPNQPKDFLKRSKRDPENWDDTVSCIDLDNAQKVLFDSLNKIAFVDDKMIRRIEADRAVPDELGARIEVEIYAIREI